MGRWTRRNARRNRNEWVGGRFATPGYVTGEGEPYRAGILIWFELPEGLVVYTEVYDPRAGEASLADALRAATQNPMVGLPRRPSRVRVESPQDAVELRARFGSALEVVVAPTPEMDELARDLAEHAGSGGEGSGSWLDDVPRDSVEVERFFEATALLHRTAPWKSVGDSTPIRVDIPALGVDGGCVSIMGAAGQSYGFLLFPSLAGLDAFAASAEMQRRGPPFDFGTTWLSLNYERGADLATKLRKDIASRRLTVAGPTAFPCPNAHDKNGMPPPVMAETLVILGATATALSSLFLQHAKSIAGEEQALSITFETGGYPPVRLTIPYDAIDLLEEQRTDSSEVRAQVSEPNRPSPIHELDERVFGMLGRYAAARFGERWLRFQNDFAEDASPQLAIPWSVYVFEVAGKPVFEHFLAECAAKLSPPERAWLEAQRSSWLSIWEVRRTEPGVGLELHDLLTGEERFVHEVGGSRQLIERTAVLGRVVECRGEAVLCGVHMRPLAPTQADVAVQAARKRLRQQSAVSVGKLRSLKIARFLLAAWERAVKQADELRTVLPKLQNADGDDLLMTTDQFSFDAGAEDAVRASLVSIEGAEADEDSIVFLRTGNELHASWDNTVVGRAVFAAGELRVETNSVRRADALRARIDSACGSKLEYRARMHSDPEAELRDPERPFRSRETVADEPPGADAMIREIKAQHVAAWLDTPIPMLGGTTPRAAAKTRHGKRQLDLLLREIEFHEAREPETRRADLKRLRRELGLP